MNKVIHGDSLEILKTLEADSVDCCITSPPYFGLRDYGVEGQIGLEETPEEFVESLVNVFRQVKRVLKKEGTVWLNLGDSYSGSGKGQTREGSQDPKRGKTNGMKLKNSSKGFSGLKSKDLIGIPWRVAFALQADGWYLRQDIIWAKPNVMPESVKDRCTRSHEHIFMLSKSPNYYYDQDAIREPLAESSIERVKYGWKSEKANMSGILSRTAMKGIDVEQMGDRFANPKGRNKRDVWFVNTSASSVSHIAMFPEKLIEPMVVAGCPEGGVVLDPFFGSGTTGLVAKKLNRNYVGIELNPEYAQIAQNRLDGVTSNLFAETLTNQE